MTTHINQILAFDCESDGLYGDVFAVGAVLVSRPHPQQQLARFTGRYRYTITDKWTREHVEPNIGDLDLYDSAQELRREFWSWLRKYQHPRKSTMVLADVAFPVESRFLTQCVADHRREANALEMGPYPLHELASLLFAIGEDPIDLNRREWPADIMPGGEMPILVQHNPFDDALSAAWCAAKALRILDTTTRAQG